MASRFEQYLQRKRVEYGTKFDASDLDSKFVSAFNSGYRIKVDFVGLDDAGNDTYGHSVKTGTVGVTTGWRPVFLLMLRKTDLGSGWTLTRRDRIIG